MPTPMNPTLFSLLMSERPIWVIFCEMFVPFWKVFTLSKTVWSTDLQVAVVINLEEMPGAFQFVMFIYNLSM